MRKDAGYEILLAEDNASDAVLVGEALKQHTVGCTLRTVRDGAQAIAFIEDLERLPGQPNLDLLILDMHLPKRDGIEVLTRLRAAEKCAGTAVIVMTGSISPDDEKAARTKAAIHYFRKPSTLDQFMELGAIVKVILSGKAEPQAR